MSLTIEVRGIPVPQGSMRAFVRGGRAVITHNRPSKLDAWRNAIATEARAAMGAEPSWDGPVSVWIDFFLQRPAGHYGKRGLKPSAPSRPFGNVGDVDKLARAALDAMTGVVFRDDAQVVSLSSEKYYGGLDHWTGALCIIQKGT